MASYLKDLSKYKIFINIWQTIIDTGNTASLIKKMICLIEDKLVRLNDSGKILVVLNYCSYCIFSKKKKEFKVFKACYSKFRNIMSASKTRVFIMYCGKPLNE